MVKYSVANHWYVAVVVPPTGRTRSSGARRQTKTFATEVEAKQFAKAMLTDGLVVTIAGTLSPHEPTRRVVAPSDILNWIEEPEQ